MMSSETILEEVSEERARQIRKGYLASYDQGHHQNDWHRMIGDYTSWARQMANMGSPDNARKRYVQVAALAVAAVEALDLDRAHREGR